MHWKSLLQWRILRRKFVCSSMSVSIWILWRRLLSELVRLLYCDEYIYNCIAMDIKSTRPMCNLAFLIICFPTLVSFFYHLKFLTSNFKFQVQLTQVFFLQDLSYCHCKIDPFPKGENVKNIVYKEMGLKIHYTKNHYNETNKGLVSFMINFHLF